MPRIKIGEIDVELRVDESLAPSVLRAFAGCTPRDTEVDSLDVPEHPKWLRFCIGLLRWYRRVRPAAIGLRCVCDPSCSRYAELAFRKFGFFRGIAATVSRLRRCRPGLGGVDVP